jgi:hypothetical protein
MDATRIRDGKQVMLKRVPVGIELEITQLLSSPGLRLEPHNHCVPVLDVIDLSNALDQKLIVMPFLRPFNKPRFQTFGEFVSFFTQICDVRTAQLSVRRPRWDLTILDPRVFSSCTNEISHTGTSSVSIGGCLPTRSQGLHRE